MELDQIYHPIEKELGLVKDLIERSLEKNKDKSTLDVKNFLLESRGKYLRPALVILSAKALSDEKKSDLNQNLVKVAAAIELIHMASLIHDDVIDHSERRHNKLTINSKWGEDISIALGDYLYSVAFELVSSSGNLAIIECISSATKAMCEGELVQVSERENLDLAKECYLVIVKKKTASLFAASCRSGTIISGARETLQHMLDEYGMNFGIAFQIIDDYLDIIWGEKKLGKLPGQDMRVGEITFPLLNLFECVSESERLELRTLLTSRSKRDSLLEIKSRIFDSGAALKTKSAAFFYIEEAKNRISSLTDSLYKESLEVLADFIFEKAFTKDDSKEYDKCREGAKYNT